MLAAAFAFGAPFSESAVAADAVSASVERDPRVILVWGDSLSAGYGMRADQSWPSLLDRELRTSAKPYRVVNGSISGETTVGGLNRIDAALTRHRPAVVVIELGANDALRGLPLATAKANLGAMIERSKAAGAEVLLVGIEMPPNFGAAFTGAFRAMYHELAETHDVPLLPFLLEPIARDRSGFLPDGLHPTPAAQPKILAHVMTELGPMIEASTVAQ